MRLVNCISCHSLIKGLPYHAPSKVPFLKSNSSLVKHAVSNTEWIWYVIEIVKLQHFIQIYTAPIKETFPRGCQPGKRNLNWTKWFSSKGFWRKWIKYRNMDLSIGFVINAIFCFCSCRHKSCYRSDSQPYQSTTSVVQE